jgi:hypothetical protein
MTAKPQRQQRTHAPEAPIGATSEPDGIVVVPLSPEVLEVARQRLLERYCQAVGESHRTGGGTISDLYNDLVALLKTRPML